MQVPPVLFIIFNRPDTTQQVFAAIRKAAPAQLFIAADGPRAHKPGESEVCEQTRAVVQQIDWPCEVQTLFRPQNLGVNKGVTDAIDWFFTHVEEGIILEDDCVPHPDFWEYNRLLLEKYRHNKVIKMIGANNFQQGTARGQGSYYFSAIPHIWGWATWKRAWQEYDMQIAATLSVKAGQQLISQLFPEKPAQVFWLKMLQYLREERPAITWDYRLPYCIWQHNGLTIIPNVNLVTNIGFNAAATTSTDSNNPLANMPVQPILPLKHPDTVIRDTEADLFYCRQYLAQVFGQSTWKTRLEELIPWKVRKQLRAIIQQTKTK